MKVVPKKIYCYADETGQDTLGNFFLVAVVLQENTNLEKLESIILKLEDLTGKNKAKWKNISERIRKQYLKAVFNLPYITNSIFYSCYSGDKQFSKLTAYSLTKAILARYKKEEIIVTVVIDGLNEKERVIVQTELKKLNIHYSKIKGLKDEQSVFLRLADAVAGFMRDYFQKEKYAIEMMKEIKGRSAPIEV